MNFDLKKHTILLTLAGSRAYGTHSHDSDVDVKGVAVPPRCFRDGYLHRFEQADKPSELACFIPLLPTELASIAAATKLDGAIFDIKKFFRLAADANPNILDALFCHPDDRIFCNEAG
jgi:predicted nucleotidyltransferase